MVENLIEGFNEESLDLNEADRSFTGESNSLRSEAEIFTAKRFHC